MTQYRSFYADVAEMPSMRRRVLFALVASLLLHGGLFIFFHFQRLENFGESGTNRLARPMPALPGFVLSEYHEDHGTVPVLEKKDAAKPISIAETMPKAPDRVIVKPDAPALAALLAPDEPKIPDAKSFGEMGRSERGLSGALANELSAAMSSLLEQDVLSPSQPLIRAGDGRDEGGAGGFDGIPGRLSVGDALQDAGGRISNTPIAVRGGALFEWGKAALRPEAMPDLQKLGELVARYPQATFVISGHTDHTGTRETNLILSQQRADAVRDWLVVRLRIDPARITTIGNADDEALPELGPEKSIEEQAPNRRVEMVIRTHGR